jgi:outer membrane protein TolC
MRFRDTNSQEQRFLLAFCLLAVGLCVGCSRGAYREAADVEVAETLAEKGGYFDHGVITPGVDSRLFDPGHPDAQPIPPDDPASHELMHSVNGHEGFDGWHDNGEAGPIDSGMWLSTLPTGDDGEVVLRLTDAVRVARTNSREYQRELEDLYLSALDVTFERFRFDTQYFAGTGTTFLQQGRDRAGNPGRSLLTQTSGASVRQLSATGGELVVGLANSLMWEFSGGQFSAADTTLNFSLVQPLLRMGGRARVLEQLTQRERTLLANVRQMEQFRQGFYVQTVTGKSSGEGPNPGGNVGASGLGLIAGSPGSTSVSGYLGLLQDLQEIRNRQANVVSLRDSLELLTESFHAGRLSTRLQVDQSRQALYSAQSGLLAAKATYQSSLDNYKISMGLPPDLPLRVADPLLDHFNLIDPEVSEIQDALLVPLTTLRSLSRVDYVAAFDEALPLIEALYPKIDVQLAKADADFNAIAPELPDRIRQLDIIRNRVEQQGADVEQQIYDQTVLTDRIEGLRTRLPELHERIKTVRSALGKLKNDRKELSPEDARNELRSLATALSNHVLELSLYQAEARLEQITLIPIQMESTQAVEIARGHRLDWMNARARLVDDWRQIEVVANDLESDLDLVVSGDIRARDDNPVKFRAEDGQLRFGLAFDSPITRLRERNNYREQLINYQRSRRSYMLFEDRITQSLRNTIRTIEVSQLNFEIARAAVRVAIAQVDLSRMRLTEPAKVNQQVTFSPTTARDVVSALRDLLDAQNNLLNVWVNYEVLRRVLDFELGTMQLDRDGIWIDPGTVGASPLSLPEIIELPPADEAREETESKIRPVGNWRPTSSPELRHSR